jgi:hypothetical protein
MRYALAVAVLIVATAVFVTSVSAADRKTTSGIYLTANDYVNGNITSEGDRNSPSHNIKLHDSIFGKPYIEVTHLGENRQYQKNEIWGFRDFDGKSYRFVENNAYEILEAQALYIYKTERLAPGRKGVSEPVYFFSVGAAAAVVPLTVTNLKTAYPENHRFHDYLDMAFRNDSDLTRFDKFHNMYKVNRLLVASSER